MVASCFTNHNIEATTCSGCLTWNIGYRLCEVTIVVLNLYNISCPRMVFFHDTQLPCSFLILGNLANSMSIEQVVHHFLSPQSLLPFHSLTQLYDAICYPYFLTRVPISLSLDPTNSLFLLPLKYFSWSLKVVPPPFFITIEYPHLHQPIQYLGLRNGEFPWTRL